MKFLTWTAVVLLVVGGAVAVMWPVETWRLYDENWQPLALTHAENHCAGEILGGNFENKTNDPRVDECVATSHLDNETPNVASSVGWFCEGIASATTSLGVADCVSQVESLDIWGLQHGGYTWEWNDANPRPVAAYEDIRSPSPDQSRTGDREGNQREGLTRP